MSAWEHLLRPQAKNGRRVEAQNDEADPRPIPERRHATLLLLHLIRCGWTVRCCALRRSDSHHAAASSPGQQRASSMSILTADSARRLGAACRHHEYSNPTRPARAHRSRIAAGSTCRTRSACDWTTSSGCRDRGRAQIRQRKPGRPISASARKSRRHAVR